MDKLIAELEQATEGSRELDRRIYKVAFRDKQSPFEERRLTTDMEYVPSYTNSLDAALTLVPEDWRVHRLREQHNRSWDAFLICRYGDEENPADVNVHAPTLCLALCLAALKARQA